MTLNTVTYEQVLDMHPCWLGTPAGRRRLKRYTDRLGGKATALDILRLSSIPSGDRLWIVLREDFIPAPILHEFACRCAERALAHVDNPDPRSIAGIEAKRKWVAGTITDEELDLAWLAAWGAEWDAARLVTHTTAQYAARACAQATAQSAAWDAAQATAQTAARSTAAAPQAKMRATAFAVERKAQIDMLIEMLEEEEAKTREPV
ncbi:hypothetical protein [Allofournierella sp.]|uniref:hypothetical protein n=1 Tax=Allofournierella sp. TaxID=1940256 RepID=UPI003AF10313